MKRHVPADPSAATPLAVTRSVATPSVVTPRRVVVSLQGGLGNQLFQWALATSLRARGHHVVLDTVRCRGDRPMAIDPLVEGWPRLSRSRGLLLAARHRYQPARLTSLVQERGTGYDESLLARVDAADSYLVGYFQSPRYFDSVADRVRDQLTEFFTSQLTPAGRATYEANRGSDTSVAVHVRRGDYVQVAKFAEHHGVLGEPYYRSAKDELERRGLRAVTWFSDDLEWVKDNLAEEGDRFCDASTTTGAAGEIALMSSCRTRVVANSTFSWWAGWLGRTPSETRPVIAPAAWFKGRPHETNDLVPTSWMRL